MKAAVAIALALALTPEAALAASVCDAGEMVTTRACGRSSDAAMATSAKRGQRWNSNSSGEAGLLLVQVSSLNSASVFRRQRLPVLAVDLDEDPDSMEDGTSPLIGSLRNPGGACLDARKRNTDVAHTWTCSNHKDQQWMYDSDAGHFKNRHGICLQWKSGSSLVSMATCDTELSAQRWAYNVGTGQIRDFSSSSSSSPQCLDASEDSIDGGRVHMQLCKVGEASQRWIIECKEKSATRVGQVKVWDGLCLDAQERDMEGGHVHMWTCEDHKNQQWVYSPSTRQLRNQFGICLQAMQPTIPGGAVKMQLCNASSLEQQWGYDEEAGQISNELGMCLDASERHMDGGVVHLWECNPSNPNQQWAMEAQKVGGVLTTTPPSSKVTTTAGDVATTSAAIATSATTTGAPHRPTATPRTGPLPPSRNCYLAPLVSKGNGEGLCELLWSGKGQAFELNEFGQETTGKANCLNKMRHKNGDTFVYDVGHCQVWHCGSKARLHASASGHENKTSLLPSVYSELCPYQPGTGGHLGREARSPVFVKLWEWNYVDIARECTEYLGPNGFDAVQVSPVVEHVLGYQWWVKYQPVSFGLNSRSGSAEEFQKMVATCRASGVQVIVDLIVNHMAGACKAAKTSTNTEEMPCVGWNGSHYGKRHMEGSRGWDAATRELFHHEVGNPLQYNCSVGPKTGWLCGSPDMRDCSCCRCDMYGGLPDWNTELPVVRDLLGKHVKELHDIGVTMLRIDAALYHEVEDLAAILNWMPWDLVYQEWWGEYPVDGRSEFVGHYRDVGYRDKMTEALAMKDPSQIHEVMDIEYGVNGLNQDNALYPFEYHDGRSVEPDHKKATYKNGLEYHQQQRFFLARPFGTSMLLWGGYSYSNLQQGPPGCEKGDHHCTALPVYDDKKGGPQCFPTPLASPLPKHVDKRRAWVCEHRWAGVAGLINFRKACRGFDVSKVWRTGDAPGVTAGRLAFSLGSDCFVALGRGYNSKTPTLEKPLGDWALSDMAIGLPSGRYCDLASLPTQKGWDRRSCPREVFVGPGGVVLNGTVPDGDIVAIHTGALLESGEDASVIAE
jgi:alpha-amylase